MQSRPTSDLQDLEKWRNSIEFAMRARILRLSLWFEPRKSWFIKNLAIVAIIGFVTSAILFVALFPHTSFASWHLFNSGTIGDSIGGMTAPFIGILNAILLWWTLKTQNQQIILQNLRADLQKRLDGIDVAIRECGLTIATNRNEQLHYVRSRGAESFFRASKSLYDLPTISELSLDPVELQVLVKNAIAIYRIALLAVDQNDQVLIASQNSNMEMSTEEWVSFYRDLVEQIDDVSEFSNAYRIFFDNKHSNEEFKAFVYHQLHYILKEKYDQLQSVFQSVLGPQEPEPDSEPDWK